MCPSWEVGSDISGFTSEQMRQTMRSVEGAGFCCPLSVPDWRNVNDSTHHSQLWSERILPEDRTHSKLVLTGKDDYVGLARRNITCLADEIQSLEALLEK
jgi:hypothetical protein